MNVPLCDCVHAGFVQKPHKTCECVHMCFPVSVCILTLGSPGEIWSDSGWNIISDSCVHIQADT